MPTQPSTIDEIDGHAIIREVHVYGAAMQLGERAQNRPQHQGFGSRLVSEARSVAARAGYGSLSVISAVGTRPYYRMLGFEDGPLYQHLQLCPQG